MQCETKAQGSLCRAWPRSTESLDLNGRGAFLSAALPSPSSLTRCHLSQSERPWQSMKLPVLHFTPCCRKGSRRRYAETFRLCQGLPLWGSWRGAPERARMLAARLRPGLAGTCGGADFRKPQSELTRCVLVSGLALSVIASRCHLPPILPLSQKNIKILLTSGN